jgi:hypothetical protein
MAGGTAVRKELMVQAVSPFLEPGEVVEHVVLGMFGTLWNPSKTHGALVAVTDRRILIVQALRRWRGCLGISVIGRAPRQPFPTLPRKWPLVIIATPWEFDTLSVLLFPVHRYAVHRADAALRAGPNTGTP